MICILLEQLINVIVDLYRKHTKYEREKRMLSACSILPKYVSDKVSPQESAASLSLTFLGKFHLVYFTMFRKLKLFLLSFLLSCFLIRWVLNEKFLLLQIYFSINIGIILTCTFQCKIKESGSSCQFLMINYLYIVQHLQFLSFFALPYRH